MQYWPAFSPPDLNAERLADLSMYIESYSKHPHPFCSHNHRLIVDWSLAFRLLMILSSFSWPFYLSGLWMNDNQTTVTCTLFICLVIYVYKFISVPLLSCTCIFVGAFVIYVVGVLATWQRSRLLSGFRFYCRTSSYDYAWRGGFLRSHTGMCMFLCNESMIWYDGKWILLGMSNNDIVIFSREKER